MRHLSRFAQALSLLVLVFALGACSADVERVDNDVDEPFVAPPPSITDPTLDGVTVHESAMTLAVAATGCALTVPITVERHARGLDVETDVQLVQVDGDATASGVDRGAIHLAAGRHDVTIALDKACLVGDAQAPGLLLEYGLTWSGQRLDGRLAFFRIMPKLQVRLLGSDAFAQGGQTIYRVMAVDAETQVPIEGASVRLALAQQDQSLASADAVTDATGQAQLALAPPADAAGDSDLSLSFSSAAYGSQAASTAVTITRNARILLTTDKPFYQPGQRIHLRALALSVPAQTPIAQRPVTLEIRDGNANVVFREEALTSDYGVASTSFTLATLVNTGNYTLRATVDDNGRPVTAEKTVTVDHYALPKFSVGLAPEQQFYQPGQTLRATIQSDYFYGKPVGGAAVHVSAQQFDVELREFATADGTLDATGAWSFSIDLPTYFVGSQLEQGDASVMLQVTVTDKASHAQTINRTIPVVANPLMVDVVPESGVLLPGVAQDFFVTLSSPLGAPLAGQVNVAADGASYDLTVPASGLARFTHTSSGGGFTLSAEAGGVTVTRTVILPSDGRAQRLMVRLPSAVYAVGDAVEIDIVALGGPSGPAPALLPDRAYLDVIQQGQTMLMTTVALDAGQGSATVDLDAGYAGPVELLAYYLTPEGQIVRASRAIFVRAASGLRVSMSTDKTTYRPREQGTITLSVANPDGAAVQAALGVTIVDEAVFALQEFMPGLEATYFQLEQAIMHPTYEIHGFSAADLYRPSPEDPADAAVQQERAEAYFAANSEATIYGVSVDTFEGQREAYAQRASQAARARIADLLSSTDYCGRRSAVIRLFAEPESTDPWGNLMQVSGSESACSLNLEARSAGPDEVFETDDDVTSNKSYTCCVPDYGTYEDAWGVWDSATSADTVTTADTAWPPPTPDPDSQGGARIVRSWFPETLIALPELITDADGTVSFDILMPDSITTWRLTSLANTAQGQLGSATDGILVYQDFFVDIDFPAFLTQNDEVHVPIGIFNYLPTAQTVTLTAQGEPWFDALDGLSKQVTVPANDVTSIYFPIRVTEIGRHSFTVDAVGSAASDAIRRDVQVRPDGVEDALVASDFLSQSVSLSLPIPTAAIPGSEQLFVKIVPGPLAQSIEGLDSILSMPSGCFEQTSSTTYPNVMVLQYLAAADKLNPEVELKARDYIAQGYQRLLTFEVTGGGFEWFGNAPAHPILTSYGLMEFVDMAQVFAVDPNVITRTAAWLASLQLADGSFPSGSGGIAEGAIDNYQDSVFRSTAYVVWALARAGAETPAMQRGAAYLLAHLSEAGDTYTRALVAMALARAGETSAAVDGLLDAIVAAGKDDGEGGLYWEQSLATSTYSTGSGANLETTALIGLLLDARGGYSAQVQGVIQWLARQKDSFGNWGTTQGTVLALRLMVQAASGATSDAQATISVSANGGTPVAIDVTPATSDVVRLVDLSAMVVAGDNSVDIVLTGTPGQLMYEAVARWYVPGSALPSSTGPLAIDVAYDTTAIQVDDTVGVTVTIANTTTHNVAMVLASVGLPPGFDLVPDLLDAAIAQEGALQRFETTPHQLLFYLYEVPAEGQVEIHYELVARWPMSGSTGEASVYPYYSPDQASDEAGQAIEVL